jgi:hypothetical protein
MPAVCAWLSRLSLDHIQFSAWTFINSILCPGQAALLAGALGPLVRNRAAAENGLPWGMDMAFRDAEFRVRKDSAPAKTPCASSVKPPHGTAASSPQGKSRWSSPRAREQKAAAKRLLFGGVEFARQGLWQAIIQAKPRAKLDDRGARGVDAAGSFDRFAGRCRWARQSFRNAFYQGF